MISVIIPSYNQQEYLPDAIESALLNHPHEVIVIDDGSTYSSLEVARRYKGIKIISQVNKGLASARNTGIMNATGDYILPLDADDVLRDDAIEKIEAKILETDADIVAPSFKTFGTSSQEIIVGPKPIPSVFDFLEANRIGYFSAIRKSKLLEIGGYSPKMTWGYEDLHLWINLLNRGAKLVTMEDILVLYRTKEHSMIATAQAHHEELMAQIKHDFPELYV